MKITINESSKSIRTFCRKRKGCIGCRYKNKNGYCAGMSESIPNKRPEEFSDEDCRKLDNIRV